MTVDQLIVLILKSIPEVFSAYWQRLLSGDVMAFVFGVIGIVIILRALPIMWIRDKLGY